MGKYLSPRAIKWSIENLSLLPKNQTVLFFFLIFATCPEVDRTHPAKKIKFESEFNRYFGGPIKGGGVAVYDPFGKEWRAENYINSTVYGRLLVGSHKWTEGSEAFFSREPKSGGWPALFYLTEDGFNNLKYRDKPPCLKYEYRLPLPATAIYYYRFEDLSYLNPSTQEDVISLFSNRVINSHPQLNSLFRNGIKFNEKELFREYPISEAEMISCFPPSPFCSDEKARALLYVEDLELIKSELKDGLTTADYVHNLLMRELKK